MDADVKFRDYFAAQALSGMLAEAGCDVHDGVVCKRAYELADAMLKARRDVDDARREASR